MDRWNYDNSRNGNGSGFAGPFLMGLAVGIAGAAVYAAARSGRLGTFMEDKVHGLEDGAMNVKNTVVEKAGAVKDTVAEKASAVKEAVVNRIHGGQNDGQASNGTEGSMTGGKSRSGSSAA